MCSARPIESSANSPLTDMDIPLERPGAVRLMSIHKSKGLQFPVVFVCGLSDKGRNDTNTEAVFFDKDFGVCINIENNAGIPDCKPNYFFTRSRQNESYMRDARDTIKKSNPDVAPVTRTALEAALTQGLLESGC